VPIDLKMAWRNVWRNPRRSLLTIFAIAFACLVLVFMLSFQFGSYETMINTSVKIYTGHLQIQAKDYQEKRDIRLVVSDPKVIEKHLKGIPHLQGFTFRAQAFSLVSSGKRTYGTLVNGIDPKNEASVSRLKSLIVKGSYLSPNDYGTVLMGQLLAKNLRVGIGNEITVLGQGRDGSIAATVLRIKGIFRTGIDQLDRSTMYIPLNCFRDVYAMGQAVHQVVMVVDSLSHVLSVKRQLAGIILHLSADPSLVVLDWEELMPGLRQGIEMDLISGVVFYLILILVVAFSILNTFLMAIFERTREFGVLMAIGVTPGRLMRLLFIESLILTLVGIGAGIVVGVLVTRYFQFHGIDISGASDLLTQFGITGRLYPRLSYISVASGPAAVLIITSLAALYPTLKVRSLQPVKAMETV